jgi:hypothetical protein
LNVDAARSEPCERANASFEIGARVGATRERGSPIDVDAATALPVTHCAGRVGFDCRRPRRWVNDVSVGIGKNERAVGRWLDAKPTLVQRDVMRVTEEHQVLECGRTAVRPMLDVMGVDECCVLASWKTTAPITQAKRAQQRRRDGAPPSPDIEHIAAFVGLGHDEPAVTREPQ